MLLQNSIIISIIYRTLENERDMAILLATGRECSSVYCTTFAYCLNMGGPGYEANHQLQQHKTLCPLSIINAC